MLRLIPALLLLPAALAATTAPVLVDSAALAGASIPSDTQLKVEATFSGQNLKSPTALTFDGKGRIFVTETHRFRAGVEDDRNFLDWYLDDLAATRTSDRLALHEKWNDLLSHDYMTEKSEIVRRLADTNGDGTLDESKVFADGFNDVLDGTAAGIFSYEDAIYLGCIPKLMMLRDTNDDGSADERKTIEEGFGVRISLSGHDLNGFALGPDGRIYGTIGDRGFNLTTKEGVICEFPNQGAVFRFEPDGSGFEVFHTGLRNPKEIAFDALGYPFTVDNNSDQGDAARIVYLVEGGDSGWEMEHQTMFSFHRQIGLPELPPSRWMDEKMWHLANPEQPAYIVPPSALLTSGPSGLTYHSGAGFLKNEAGRFMICDYRGSSATSGIWSFAMEPDGAGMKMSDAHKLLWGVAATDAEFSWDGRLFVTDFIGGWASHDNGRLLSLDARENTWLPKEAASSAKLMAAGLDHRSSAELANYLKHPDARIRLRAQLALTRKDDALKRFSDAIVSSDLTVRIHGIWGLGILARRGASPLPVTDFSAIPSDTIRTQAEKKLLALLKDNNEEIRCQTLRALIDASSKPAQLPLGPLLGDDSLRVRFFAAMLVGKRKIIGYYGPICDMLAENDNRDPLLRHAGVFALQHMAPDSKILRALSFHKSPAVRLAAVVALRRMKSPDLDIFIRDKDPAVVDEAIRAICDLDLANRRSSVAVLLDSLGSRDWSPLMLRRLLHNSFRIGDTENATRVLNFAKDPQQPEALRKEAFRLLSEWLKPFPADQFTGHWRPIDEREPEVLIPLLTAELPALLSQNDFSLTAALRLINLYQLTIPKLTDDKLRGIVTNAELPDAARNTALDLLAARNPSTLDVFLTDLIKNAPDEIAINALARLATNSIESAIPSLAAALDSGSPTLMRAAWEILSKIPGETTDALFVKHLNLLRSSNGVSPHAIELLAAAKTRESAAVATALAAVNDALAASSDPLALWNIALEGGSPEAGEALFTSHPAAECSRCHRLTDGHDVGGDTAPNLSGIANRQPDRRYFLESLINPHAVIAPGFGIVAVDFKNGTSINGNLIATTDDHIDLEANGKHLRIPRGTIDSTTRPTSAMPAMGDLLAPSELRDIIAWLASLEKDDTAPDPAITPEPFDPDSLLTAEKNTRKINPATMKSGRSQFIVCGACHGQNGEGSAAGPPLAGSEWVNGPAENLIRIQLRGLEGPITVKGQTYDIPAGMAPLAYQTDEQIAAVLTYVRNSFGNSAPAVTPAEVTALRSEVGKPKVTVKELTPPSADTSATPSTPSEKYDDLSTGSNLPKWIAALVGALALLSLIPLFKRKNP